MDGALSLRQRARRKLSRPLLWSIVLHLVVAAALLLQLNWHTQDLDLAGEVIEAVAVDAHQIDAEKNREQQHQQQIREQQSQQQLQAQQEAERQAREQEQQRLQVQRAEEKRQQEQQRKQQEEEAIRLAKQKEAERLKQEQQKKREQDLARQKAEQEKQQREKQEKEKQEKEKRETERRAEEQRQLQQAQRQEMERLQAEERAAAEKARAGELAQKLALYKDAIKQRVDRNWIRPMSVQDWYSCEVIVHQIPGGDVIDVEVKRCDGDAVFQRSVLNAINKSSPLPDPPDPALFDRNLHFTFKVPAS